EVAMTKFEYPAPDYTPLDPLLARLAPYGGELSNGLTNHAPMVVEALCALGRGAAAGEWLDGYAPGLLPWPPPSKPIDASDGEQALGSLDRLGDWRAFLVAELERRGWRDVVRDWVPRLAPGLSGAATHGVIRAAHAVRTIAERDTAPRRAECAAGLAYWAATYRRLPDAGTDRRLDGAGALRAVPWLP